MAGSTLSTSPHDGFVPEAENTKATTSKVGVAARVVAALRMLPAVEPDDQVALKADEIDDCVADGSLAAEFQTVEATAAKTLPHPAPGVCTLHTPGTGDSTKPAVDA